MTPIPLESLCSLPLSNDSNSSETSENHLWHVLQKEALHEIAKDALLTDILRATILDHDNLEDALGFQLAQRLAGPFMPYQRMWKLFTEILLDHPTVLIAACADMQAIRHRDPACASYLQAFLSYKGIHALESYRISHVLWIQGQHLLAFFLQNRISEVFGVDIHPAARLGHGIFIDHGTGIVIGETAVVEDDVSILHEVTLGGTGKEKGDRHPKIRRGTLIGAGAKLLGNIEIGRGAKVGASSVVLNHVPPYRTVVGVPAKVVGVPNVSEPAFELNHRVSSAQEYRQD